MDKSGSAGVFVADDGSAFGPGSARLSVSNSADYAVRMGANHADSIPVDRAFHDNTFNEVELSGNVSRTQRWAGRFVVKGTVWMSSETEAVTLTISAGAVLRFERDAELATQLDTTHRGSLIVDGSSEAPVLFTACLLYTSDAADE